MGICSIAHAAMLGHSAIRGPSNGDKGSIGRGQRRRQSRSSATHTSHTGRAGRLIGWFRRRVTRATTPGRLPKDTWTRTPAAKTPLRASRCPFRLRVCVLACRWIIGMPFILVVCPLALANDRVSHRRVCVPQAAPDLSIAQTISLYTCGHITNPTVDWPVSRPANSRPHAEPCSSSHPASQSQPRRALTLAARA